MTVEQLAVQIQGILDERAKAEAAGTFARVVPGVRSISEQAKAVLEILEGASPAAGGTVSVETPAPAKESKWKKYGRIAMKTIGVASSAALAGGGIGAVIPAVIGAVVSPEAAATVGAVASAIGAGVALHVQKPE
jgi:hypothetical protein